MLVRALHISAATGEVKTIDLGKDTLKAMYAAIDCRVVELVRLPNDVDLWMDEEGGYREDLASNYVATAFARETSGLAWPVFKGDALIATTDGEGATVGLDDRQYAQITHHLEQVRGAVSRFLAAQGV